MLACGQSIRPEIRCKGVWDRDRFQELRRQRVYAMSPHNSLLATMGHFYVFKRFGVPPLRTPCHELLIFQNLMTRLGWHELAGLCAGVQPGTLTTLPSPVLVTSDYRVCSSFEVPKTPVTLVATHSCRSFCQWVTLSNFNQSKLQCILSPLEKVLQKLSYFVHKLSLNLRLGDRHRVSPCATLRRIFLFSSASDRKQARKPIHLRLLI